MTAVEVGPSSMPNFVQTLSVADIRAVSHFVADNLAIIPLTSGDLVEGGVLYRTYCASCHHSAGRGAALPNLPINGPSLTNKSAARIAGAIRWGPGPMPSFPPAMLNDAQLASTVDYVRTLQRMPNPGGASLAWYGPVPEGIMACGAVFGLIIATTWIEKGGKG